ncbi:cytochrome P450 [Streptomyces sp. DSM 15324]|uniref:cytochrome P450 n=1 Tax=Streptomyces sp. DSM 15324 TaxID=1739111 RepID=UPI000829F7E5|nr:cytochrome P450 [Streptomyces sp. DSM 15324]
MEFQGTTLATKEACVHALRQPELSSNPGGAMAGSANLLFMDNESHIRLRAVVRDVIGQLEPLPHQVTTDIRAIVQKLHGRNDIDLVADFGRPVAAIVAAAVLAVEQELTAELLDQISGTAANLGVWIGDSAPAGSAMHKVVRFFLKATAIHDGGLDRLRRARKAGEITEDELLVTPVMLVHAAYENSTNFLAAAALQLSQSPSLAEQFVSGSRQAGAVREMVNQICPTRHVMRRATKPLDVAGTHIQEGECVAISIGPPNALAFGTGSHSCPGIKVALTEAEFALREIAPLLAASWRTVSVEEKNHFVFHGLSHALIRRDSSSGD